MTGRGRPKPLSLLRSGVGPVCDAGSDWVEGGLNTFGYVAANPIKLTDPLGLYKVVNNGGTEEQAAEVESYLKALEKHLKNENQCCKYCPAEYLDKLDHWVVEITSRSTGDYALTFFTQKGPPYTTIYSDFFDAGDTAYKSEIIYHEFRYLQDDSLGSSRDWSDDMQLKNDLWGTRCARVSNSARHVHRATKYESNYSVSSNLGTELF
ncbi:hypothetical protein ACT048_24900 [Ectopseudomonas khazarica]|uniref:hypothetical protein n=1 Tax=Ectopseudomonas khazarica TaxID=2502979 RepID=UPI004033B9A9